MIHPIRTLDRILNFVKIQFERASLFHFPRGKDDRLPFFREIEGKGKREFILASNLPIFAKNLFWKESNIKISNIIRETDRKTGRESKDRSKFVITVAYRSYAWRTSVETGRFHNERRSRPSEKGKRNE